MGVVFEAVQESLGRSVALKVLPSHISLNRGALERFRREATTASKIDHPAIAKVYAVGKDQDLNFFAMELITGPSLEKTIEAVQGQDPSKLHSSLLKCAGFERGTWLPPSPHAPFFAASTAWIAEIAEALTTAHNMRVLHRDLKPSNIIIRPNASPVLVDFGLSQDSMETGLTRTGDAVGTPAYMSPEQATGARDLDDRVDVYGLGATLYELVTLRAPFTGNNAPAIMQKILDEEVVPPSKINSACPRDLETIILTCLQKPRDSRYRSTRELAVDLRNFLRGETIQAKAPSAGSKIRRSIRKRRKMIAASATTAAVLAVGVAGFAFLNGRWEQQSGEEQLGQALAALAVGDQDAAFRAFSNARGTLGDQHVKNPWLDRLGLIVEERLREGKGREVTQIVNKLATFYARDDRVVQWLERARGRGIVRIKVEPPDAHLKIRRIDEAGEVGQPVVMVGERLPAGRYLFELDAGPDYEVAETILVVERGKTVSPYLATIEKTLRPKGTVFCAGAPGQGVGPFFIDRCEVTNAQYYEYLQSLPPSQRASREPQGGSWRDGRPPRDALERPVRGVRVSDAVGYARFRGGHLPSYAEFQAAGNLGGDWHFPWGAAYDASRVAADPMRMSRPKAVGGRSAGASRCGAHDLVGNVAEWVLSRDGLWVAAGGSYSSDEADLSLGRAKRLRPETAPREVGFRIAYNAATKVYDRSGKAYDEHWKRRFELGQLQTRTTVEYTSDGRPTVMQRFAGNVLKMGSLPASFSLQLGGGRGFFSSVDSWMRLGTETLSILESVERTDLRRYDLDFESVVRLSKGVFDVAMRASVLPRSMTTPVGGGRFVHRFPIIRRPGLTSQHFLVLPAASHIERVSVPQYESYIEKGKRIVAFEQTSNSRSVSIEAIEVEFVMDTRGAPLPEATEIEARAAEFFAAWRDAQDPRKDDGDRRLRALQDISCCFGPNGIQAAELRKALRKFRGYLGSADPLLRDQGEKARLRFGKPRLKRLAALGDLVVSDFEIDVEGRLERMQVRWIPRRERGEADWKIYDIRPASRSDVSQETATAFLSPELGIEVRKPAGFAARRLVQHATRMQLRFDLVDEGLKREAMGSGQDPIKFSILVLADETGEGERMEQFAPRLTRHIWPLWARIPWGSSDTTLGGGHVARSERFLLSREWRRGGGRAMFQEEVRARSGTVGLLVIGIVACNGSDARVFQDAWKRKLGEVFRRVVEGVRFTRI